MRRIGWLLLTGLVTQLTTSCGIVESPESVGRVWLDSYATSNEIRLYWHTSNRSGFDSGLRRSRAGPRIARVLLQRSTAGPDRDFEVILQRDRSGDDSTTVAGLRTGGAYWFRVVALDIQGRELLQSNPVQTLTGPPTMSAQSLPLVSAGRFSWSPGGDSIAYVDASVLSQCTLTLLDVSTASQRPVASCTGDAWMMDAIWSHDGSSIAFTRTPTLTAGGIDYRIWSTGLAPGSSVPRSAGRVDFDAAWGGEWLYFFRGTFEPPNVPELWRMRPADASSMQQLTRDPSVHKYSPDVRGTDDCVVYEGRSGEVTRLYLLHPGGAPTALTAGRWYQDKGATWHPDGRHVAFVSNRSGHAEIWSVDATSGALRQLTRFPRGQQCRSSRWSPDGRRLGVIAGQQGGRWVRGSLELLDGLVP